MVKLSPLVIVPTYCPERGHGFMIEREGGSFIWPDDCCVSLNYDRRVDAERYIVPLRQKTQEAWDLAEQAALDGGYPFALWGRFGS